MVEDKFELEITDDKSASTAITSFLKNKDVRYFEAVKKYLEQARFSSVKVDVENVNDLFFEVEGQSILKYILENEDFFDYRIKNFIANNLVTLKACLDMGHTSILDYLEEKTLYQEYESGKTVFDYLLETNMILPKNINSIWDDLSVVQKIKNKDEKLLLHLNGYVLFNTTIDGVKTIEYLFIRGLVTPEVIKKINSNTEIFDLCMKYNRVDLLPYLQERILVGEKDGKTILEYLLDNNIKPELNNIYNEKVIQILLNHRLFDYFKDAYEGTLVEEIFEGKTILDVLLENGCEIKTNYFSKKESLEIFLKHGRFDMIAKFGVDILVSLCNLNETYLDFLLNQKSMGADIRLTSISAYSNDVHKLAMFYIIVARHGFINHVSELEEGRLTRNNGELLKELLNIDKDLTLNVILSRRVKENFDVAMLLKLNGVEQKDIKIDLHSMDLVDKYYEDFNREYRNATVSDEAKLLLEEFRNLMLSDGNSDPNLIEAMITSYTYLLSTNNEYGERELRKLIELKKKKKDFHIKKNKDGSFYRGFDNSINLENTNLNTLNHETGHALFHNLTDMHIPQEYERIIFEIQNNPEVLKKVEEYSKKFQFIKDSVISFVENKYMKDYHISEDRLAEIEEFINKQREEQKKIYLEKGYDEETIDSLLKNVFSLDEYIEQDRRIKKEELIDAILRSEYGAFISIGDIIDSIFVGKFRSNELLNIEGNVIKSAFGHGIAYYDRGVEWSFDETMANFSAISKSVDSVEILSYLKSIVGERFINCIEDYYRNQISLSTKELSEEEEKTI